VARDNPRRKVGRAIDLLLACLIVIMPVGLLHFVTAWGETDTISLLVHDIERGRWAGAVLYGAVLLLCGGAPSLDSLRTAARCTSRSATRGYPLALSTLPPTVTGLAAISAKAMTHGAVPLFTQL
jgi:hypothetical protein